MSNLRNSFTNSTRDLNTDLCLVSCVKTKRARPSPAKDLFTSPAFVKKRQLIERKKWPWLILSSEYGLVHPNKVIAPYDTKLGEMDSYNRRDWAMNVMADLNKYLIDVNSVMFLAYKPYHEFLVPMLKRRGIEVSVPMEHLSRGEQLSWLNTQIENSF